jgi:hypothetical protein
LLALLKQRVAGTLVPVPGFQTVLWSSGVGKNPKSEFPNPKWISAGSGFSNSPMEFGGWKKSEIRIPKSEMESRDVP